MSKLSPDEEESVLAELEALQAQALPSIPSTVSSCCVPIVLKDVDNHLRTSLCLLVAFHTTDLATAGNSTITRCPVTSSARISCGYGARRRRYRTEGRKAEAEGR